MKLGVEKLGVGNTMGSDPMVKKSFIFEMPSGAGARTA